MSAGLRRPDGVSKVQRAAELYLAGEITIDAAAERFGLQRGSIRSAAHRIKRARRAEQGTP